MTSVVAVTFGETMASAASMGVGPITVSREFRVTIGGAESNVGSG